jgi:hypothetical protein
MASNLIRKRKNLAGSETLNQITYLDNIGSKAVTGDILAPGDVITANTSTAGVLVGKGAILRVEATSGTFIAFGASDIAAVNGTTSPALKHPGNFALICATDDYIRTSAALTRLEIMHKG